MTTKTENLEAWEALKLLQEGEPVVKDAHGAEWYPEDLRDKSDLRLDQFVSRAPYRLAKTEKQSAEEDTRALFNQLIRDLRAGANVGTADSILSLIRTEARNIAQDEIAKLRKEIGYGTITISKEAIVASKDDSWSEKIKRFQEREAERNYISPKVTLSGQDRGEPNE